MRILWILKDKRVIQNIFQKGLFWNKFDKYVNHIHVAFATNILIIVCIIYRKFSSRMFYCIYSYVYFNYWFNSYAIYEDTKESGNLSPVIKIVSALSFFISL